MRFRPNMEIVFFWFCLWLQWIILFLLMMLFSTWCLLAFNEQRFAFFSIYSYPFSLDVAKLVVLGGKLPMVTCVFFIQVSTFIHYTFALMLTNMYENIVLWWRWFCFCIGCCEISACVKEMERKKSTT